MMALIDEIIYHLSSGCRCESSNPALRKFSAFDGYVRHLIFNYKIMLL